MNESSVVATVRSPVLLNRKKRRIWTKRGKFIWTLNWMNHWV